MRDFSLDQALAAAPTLTGIELDARDREELTLEAGYAGYVEREQLQIEKRREAETSRIPRDLDFGAVPNLRTEAREKFGRIRPSTIGQAARIAGIGPADIGVLIVHLKARRADWDGARS
jgi:tRNA uridine 5-carboxymethylaminomethyl modification enzyme